MRSPSVARHARRLRAACVIAAASLLCGLPLARPAMAAGHQPSGPARQAAVTGRSANLYQTPGQALAQARRTGKAVPVTGATSPTSTLTANPDGSFTLTQSAAPVRAKVNGTWRALDSRLVRNQDGTYSPATSSHPLALSGGGSGPLATMAYGSYSLALTAPVRLPAPSVSGNTATYAGIFPGVSLIVTARPSGDYSEVLRVDTPTAARNPALTSLAFASRAKGLSLRAASNGTITARTPGGQVIFASPTPLMWDSAASPRLRAMAAKGGSHADPAGQAPASASPGTGAHVRQLGVTVSGSRLTLTPDRGLLTGSGAVFPEYIDPDWSTPSPGPSASNWAYVSSDFPDQPYFDGSSYLQVGHNPDSGGTSYAFYQLPISSVIRGAYIHSATAYFPEVWADSCTASPVDLYQTNNGISSATTYNHQPGWGTPLGSANVAYGWSPDGIGGTSSCPIGAKDVSYDVRSVIATDAATTSGAMPTLNVGLKAESGADVGWKKFANPRTPIAENATITIQYANHPDKPGLTTSPAADCTKGTSTLGNGNITLNALVRDKDGGTLAVTYAATANGHTFASNTSMTASAGSGTTAHLPLSIADLDAAVTNYGGGTKQVSIAWSATVSDGLSGVATSSATCKFTFSTAKPGRPDITNCDDGSQSYAVGTPALFTVTANTSSGVAAPTSYAYQLNGANPVTFAAGSASPYAGHFSVAPTRQFNVVTVIATAANGTIGDTAVCQFTAVVPGPAADQDMNGDGIPDLLTVGNGTTGTASGLWLAGGQGSSGRFNGTVAPTATDIGPYGPQGMGTTASTTNPGAPADWNGLKAITGQFLGPGFNAVEAYSPSTGAIYVTQGQGDGSIATSQDDNFTSVLQYQQVDAQGNQTDTHFNPVQLASTYNVSGSGVPYPDQMGTFTDPAVGSFLAYFAADDGTAGYDSANGSGLPFKLDNPTPDGTMDWPSWTVATGSDTRGGTSYTDMYLWNKTSGALYLWELTGLINEVPGGTNWNDNPPDFSIPTATLSYTPAQLSANWNKNASLASLQATDITGKAALMDVTSAGQVETWKWDGTTLSRANSAGSSQKLLTADHTYLLDDVADDGAAVTTATDQPGAGKTEYDLSQNTGATGATWNSGDPVFSPDLQLDGTSGFLTTSSQNGDFTPSSSFSVSAWVNLAALGGSVFSQNGSSYSTVKVSATTGGQWQLGVNTSGSTYATATGGTVRTGTWTSLTLTYDASAGILKLYANGTEVAYMGATPLSQTGKFLVGASQTAGNAASFLNGQVGTIQVWDSLATPVEPPAPASAYVPLASPVRLMDTRSNLGANGPVAAGSTITLQISGNATAGLPSTGITAAAVSVTITGQSQPGYLTLYPDGTPKPSSSTLNFNSADSLTNNAIVPIGGNGKIAIYNYAGGGDQVLVDLTGYFTTSTSASGASTYTPLANPARLFFTGNGTGLPNSNPVAAGGTFKLKVTGDNTNGAGIPATGVTALALNIGAIAPSGDDGWIAVWGDGAAQPAHESNINFHGPETYQSTVIVPVGANGTIDIYNGSSQPIDLVGDLSGYFTAATTGQYYHAFDGTRIVDTRQTTALAANTARTFADPVSVVANDPTLVLNVTATGPANAGYLKAYPGSQSAPGTSILTFTAAQTMAGLALVSTTSNNSFNIYNASAGTTDVILDTDGYFQ